MEVATDHIVHFYFAESPFCEPGSGNQSLITQNLHVPERVNRFLANKEKFEGALTERTGLQYVIEHDAMTAQKQFIGLNGPEFSHFWVIRAQDRLGPGKDNYKVLGYYYILGRVLYPAVSVANILENRILNCVQGMDQVVKTVSGLPLFSATGGYTYFPPNQKSTATAESVRGSRAGTPLPEAIAPVTQDAMAVDDEDEQTNEAVLRMALRKTMNFGGQYYDNAPLVGEPGSFRYGTRKDPIQNLKASEVMSKAPSTASTPAPSSQAVKPPSTPASPTGSTKVDVEPSRPKPKRKKSMAVNEPT